MPSNCLNEIIDAINNSDESGISIEEYMNICLYHPKHGYYMTKDPFGEEGDFVTSPEISQIFGDVIGGFFVQNWVRMGRPSPFSLMELGPGRGTLMADIWRTAQQALPDFCKNAEVNLIETSQNLRETQQHNLSDIEKIKWYHNVNDTPDDRPIFLLCNEFLDALPIKQFIFFKGQWKERLVTWNKDLSKLTWKVSEKILEYENEEIKKIKEKSTSKPDEGDIYETCPAAINIMRTICRRLKKQKGMAIFIDYGYIDENCGSTLQAVYKHEYSDFLTNTGKQDLTAHVNFSVLQKVAEEEGVSITGTITQAEFLKSLGAEQYTEALIRKANIEQEKTLMMAYHRLVSAFEMGYLFKVLGISY